MLEAAIRAGLNVDYGCNSGNCGRCSAQVLSGEIEKIRHCDYVQSAAGKAQRKFLMCSYTAVSDLIVDAQLGDWDTVIPEQSLRVKVRDLKKCREDLCIVSLRTPRSQRLRFFAGQYARLSGAGFEQADCSIASCPCEDQRLEFHIRRSDGTLSQYVFNDCRIGDELQVTAPFGDFLFSENVQRAAMLVAFETGFAPIKSLIEHVTGQEQEVPLYLYWISAADKPYLDNLCRAWNDAFDHFHYTSLQLDADCDQALYGCAQNLAQERTTLCIDDVYMCTPRSLGDVIAGVLAAQEAEPAHLFREVLR